MAALENVSDKSYFNVVVAPINPDDQDADYLDEQDQPNQFWTDYKLENRFERQEHTYMMGMTSPQGFNGNSVGFVQLAAPTLLWVARWTACKVNDKPDIPASAPSSDSDWVLLARHITTYKKEVMQDGTSPIWRISGVFVYGNQNPDPDSVAGDTNPGTSYLNDMFWPIPAYLKDLDDRSFGDATEQFGLIDLPDTLT